MIENIEQEANDVNPHNLGFCCRYACNETCVGCGDSENGIPLEFGWMAFQQLRKDPKY